MCRGKITCSELGSNPKQWDQFAPLRAPGWAIDSIDIFVSAVNDFLKGDRHSCLNKIATIRSHEITEWYIEHGQMSGRHRNLVLNTQPPKVIHLEQRDPIRSPKRIQRDIFKRDAYRCRYCGNKLISQDFLKEFIKTLNSTSFQRGKTNLTTHGIIHLTWPVADHVIPWKYGGRTDEANLVSACAPCNYGKDHYTIEQLGIENPFERTLLIDGWDGLESRISNLKNV